MSGDIRLRPLLGVPRIAAGDDLAGALAAAAQRSQVALRGAVLVVCQKVVSKQEGRVVDLASITPSAEAARIAAEDGKDPRQIEVILRETRRVVRRGHGVLITETHHGFVCANAGVDLSNAPADGYAVLLPVDPDASARRLRAELLARGADEPLGVVISDTFGRPWREGLVDVAIGSAGFRPLDDWRGRADLRGRELTVTVNATADQLAAAAGLLMAKDAGIPAVLCEGVTLEGDGTAQELVRKAAIDLFR
ncbi:MAG TPA: coenzyme F420-0:L-glutamate ligase [Myxococcota bacterium]|nr:coenzyme F420-0:L-glutamate ligase [Myxococcota bacterium]